MVSGFIDISVVRYLICLRALRVLKEKRREQNIVVSSKSITGEFRQTAPKSGRCQTTLTRPRFDTILPLKIAPLNANAITCMGSPVEVDMSGSN